VSIERPPHIEPKWCPDCGEEMQFSGTQSAGLAQFFCERCRYRHDTFVGRSTVEKAQSFDDGAVHSESD
jgi:hypothetical protein